MDNFKKGYVFKHYISDKHGYIKDQDGLKYFYLLSNIIEDQELKIGDAVTFMSFEGVNGLNAKFISKLIKESIEIESDLPKKISSEWLMEALNETNAKFFYFSSEMHEIVDGDKCFVIGRKGMGKTAIAEYLYELNNFDIYTEKLSFKSFPINELYEKEDSKFSLQNKFISIWKYIIYGSVLKMMSKNERINPNLTKKLRKIFPLDSIDTLERKIDRLKDISFSFTGLNVSYKENESIINESKSILEKSQQFENIIKTYIDDSKYYVIIDALDDDYSDIKKREEYFYLLNGLHKAVQEIKSIFPKKSTMLYPVVFLRDDIFRQIDDSDKLKWRDYSSRIYWDKQKMLAYRISRTIDPKGVVYDFELAFSKLFPFADIDYKGHKMSVFRLILERSYMRPRDFIVFIKLCCERAIKKESKINKKIVIHSIDSFSSYLLEDIEYEIKPFMPEIGEVISILAHLRKPIFTYREFNNELNNAISNGIFNSTKNSVKILSVLYDFNIIGNITQTGREIFSMYNSNQKSSLNFNERMKVKNGLETALGF